VVNLLAVIFTSPTAWVSDVDINTSDTSTPTHNQISDPITRARAPTKQLGILIPSFLFILYRQWKRVFCCVA
jgi:hypothetical protein